MVGSGEEISGAARQELRIADLRGQIALLDETLTMSARMAAWSGDGLWAQRFEDMAPQLDAAIATATTLAGPESRRSLGATLSEAHRDLSLMHQRAFALAKAGDKAGAQDLLNGPEFQYIRDVFASGLDVLGHRLRQEAEIRAAQISRRAWMRAGCFGLMAMLLVMAVMAAQQRVRLRAAACIDPLTQLPNRRQFYAHLIGMLEGRDKGATDRYMLVVIGIDHFKMINDSYGHAAADDLLQRVTERLRQAAPPSTFLARVGGDEFALLVEAPPPWIVQEAPVEDIIAALSDHYGLEDGRRVQLGFSAGAVWMTFKESSVGDIMRQAGTALRQAKRDGRGRLRIFDHTMDEVSRDRALLEADLRHAIDRGEIVPFFQPLVDLQSNRIVGVEALARWRHAERGWISPATFIPMAEELGLIDGLMERMLRQACRAALRWPAHVTVAFNVSPLQLRNDALPGQIRAILAETGFPARRLEVEVTESALVTDLELARRLLEDLRASGVRLALDDFGTGYSSLKHLRCLPFDKLKIDASFVGGMVDDGENGKIVAAVVGLGHSLGLSTVAEGVETPQVSVLLRELGCDIGQGWLYGRPVPAAALDFHDTEAGQAA